VLFEESIDEVWSRIGLVLSRDVLERRYNARHGGSLSAQKAKEIVSHLQQGQQYFKSAQTAGILAGPLEQYYGVLALTRALILYLIPRAREATLTKGHGLGATLANDGKLENIRLTVANGTFYEFLRATGNAEEITAEMPGVTDGDIPFYFSQRFTVVRSLPGPSLGDRFQFIDLLSRIPDLREHFEEAFSIPAHCYRGRVSAFFNTITVTVERGMFELPAVDELAGLLQVDSSVQIDVKQPGSVEFSAPMQKIADGLAKLPIAIDRSLANYAVLEPFRSGWSLSILASYFAAAHALSMIVRYYPTRWAQLLSQERGDRLLPVLERLRGLVQTDFVRLALRELERTSGP